MRIVLVNWAKLWDGAGYGGGVNGYCQSLALALVDRGHEVVSLFGGTTFVPAPTPEKTSPCFIRRHEDWMGVRVFEVVNSPVMAPSIVQYQEPLGEVSSPELEAEVGRLFDLIKPDVVHFHNIEGFSIGCVGAARNAGAKTIFSLHNYHTICPQVYLMQGHRVVCHDFEGGKACATCIPTKPPKKERRDRAIAYQKAQGGEQVDRVAELEREVASQWGGIKHEFSWPVRVMKGASRLMSTRAALRVARDARMREGTATTVEPPGFAVRSEIDAVKPMPVTLTIKRTEAELERDRTLATKPERPADHRGQTQGLLDEREWTPTVIDETLPERRPLSNVAKPDPSNGQVANDYGKRRVAMVKMLSGCDRVLAVSGFVRDKFVSMGVDPSVIRALPIGSRINRVVERGRELVFDPPAFTRGPWQEQRPVKLIFMGYNNYYKGLHILAEALGSLTPEYLRHIDLSVFALDGQSIEWMFRRMEPRLAKLTFVGGYQYQDIPWMAGGKDLGVVPSVWWDNAPQTVFEFMACGVPVLGAAVGGIPDFVRDGENGMLFRGNDPWDLARRIAEAIREPWKLTEMRSRMTKPKDIDEHVLELEGVYAGVGGG